MLGKHYFYFTVKSTITVRVPVNVPWNPNFAIVTSTEYKTLCEQTKIKVKFS